MATKSKGVGRGFGSGGRRPGAGRKPLKGSVEIARERAAAQVVEKLAAPPATPAPVVKASPAPVVKASPAPVVKATPATTTAPPAPKPKKAAPAPAPKPKAKPQPKTEAIAAQALIEAVKAACETTDLREMPEPTFDELEGFAKKALVQVLSYSPKDDARVAAAKLVKDWAQVQRERAAETAGMTGKKAQAQAKAETHAAAGSKFAPPPAPRFQ